VNTLSKGYKQRVCFAQSILHDPEYLILDEPTDGLDPNQKHEVRLMIREMSATKAIIFSTHILDEVDTVCSRAIIIADGKVVADDTPDGLRQRSTFHGSVVLTVKVRGVRWTGKGNRGTGRGGIGVGGGIRQRSNDLADLSRTIRQCPLPIG
jgi:ABC-type multidrug transport system ATPase subunit